MSYDARETSIESGQPVEVYTFTVGDLPPIRYTSTEDEVTLGLFTFEPRPIRRGATEDDLERRDATFEVTLPASDPLVQLFRNVPPGSSVELLAQRFHRGDSEVVTFFRGEVQSLAWRKNLTEAVLAAMPAIAAKTHAVPRFTYQGPCNHALYDPATCKVDSTDPAFRAASYPVSAQVGRILTVPGLSTDFPADWFVGGMVEIVGGLDFRMVTSQSGDDLELLLPFVSQPSLVNVYAGCAHDPDSTHGCGPKFDNGDNYGGFFFIPKKNPFESGI